MGGKRIEFRKRLFNNTNKIESVYMYTTYPIKKIVGIFNIDSIVRGSPTDLWERFKNFSGMNKDEFFKYFGSETIIFTIKIKDVKPFNPPLDPNSLFSNFTPPRSFKYVKNDLT